MQLKVRNAVVCDLVRIENSGKHILIGAFGGPVILAKIPGLFAPTFWLEVATLPTVQKFDFEAELSAPTPKPLGNATITADSAGEDSAIVILTGLPIEVITPGRLQLRVRLPGGRWSTAVDKEIRSLESATPPP